MATVGEDPLEQHYRLQRLAGVKDNLSDTCVQLLLGINQIPTRRENLGISNICRI